MTRTLSNRTFEIVRDWIASGFLPCNAPLIQDELATKLGVSRLTLRESLARLEQEGFVVGRANRGYFVQSMSVDQMNEIYALLLALEPNAAAHAAGLATLVDQTAAIEAYHRLESAVDQDISTISICNRVFHLSIIRPGNRDFTTQLIERLHTLSARYVVAYLQPKSRCIQAYKTHATLLDAFISRDQAGLSELLSDHIRITLEDLVHQVELSKRLRQTKRTSW